MATKWFQKIPELLLYHCSERSYVDSSGILLETSLPVTKDIEFSERIPSCKTGRGDSLEFFLQCGDCELSAIQSAVIDLLSVCAANS
ncbi:hypothetical protein AVEN_41074-1 [Araneus ventricosus]|uniref:Uncharacterized protein n=1 Tax=Araneus ventricosus TaxID=182803 RepID=A0A4Y2CJA9_ARAVE|nr:hypothetical protein AVEN_41074-1 [Araneus ventricosus]